MPLIYSGQEYDLSHRLKFFEKDSIPKLKGKSFALLEELGKLKNTNVALNGGKEKATFEVLDAGNNMFALERSKNGKTILFIANLSKYSTKFSLSRKGKYQDFLSNEYFELNGNDEAIGFSAFQYKILVK